jgi:hypothetical protein
MTKVRVLLCVVSSVENEPLASLVYRRARFFDTRQISFHELLSDGSFEKVFESPTISLHRLGYVGFR